MYRNSIKPIFDILLSFVVIIAISPVYLILMILLGYVNQGNPFFTQLRPGKNAINFRVIKFKTMNDRKDERGHLLPDEDRMHAVGKFIRKTSLDELPQLINVVKGDMSLVGPRPLLPSYLPLYSQEQSRRHEVKPGVTGWVQVNGRNSVSWIDKFKMDVWYVDHQSFKLDIKILILTVKKVILKEDINYEGQATTLPFEGNKNQI